MKEQLRKYLFLFCRFVVRSVTSRFLVSSAEDTAEPAVYVVHHQNLRGPLLCMVWFHKILRPWVLNVFCDWRSCFRQYYGYTFTQRFSLPKPLAFFLALPASFFVAGIMKLIRAIPVFRGSRAIIETFKESVNSLIQGQSLLICPDIDYTDASSQMGEMYRGFLDLEKYYRKRTGKHLAFIPLQISAVRRRIRIGRAVYLHAEDFKQGKEQAYALLQREFGRLESLNEERESLA